MCISAYMHNTHPCRLTYTYSCVELYLGDLQAPAANSPEADALPLASISLGLGGLLAGARNARHFSKTSSGPWLRRSGALGGLRSAPLYRALATVLAEGPREIRTPPGDPRSYRVLQLENGLQVLLASDPSASTSAAALTVQCGTFQDPKDRLGLAHFHEHMLFLGTEKFPKEDEYSKYLSEHGGDSNAFTMSEYTTYYFKVP